VAATPAAATAAAVAAAATTAAAATAAAATTAATAGPLLGDRDLQLPPLEILAVPGRDRGLGLGRRRQLHEPEPARLAGCPIGHDLRVDDLAAVRLERGAQCGVGGAIRQIPYI